MRILVIALLMLVLFISSCDNKEDIIVGSDDNVDNEAGNGNLNFTNNFSLNMTNSSNGTVTYFACLN